MTYLSSDHMNLIPMDFEKNLTNLRSGLSFLIEQYQTLYNAMERISKNLECKNNNKIHFKDLYIFGIDYINKYIL